MSDQADRSDSAALLVMDVQPRIIDRAPDPAAAVVFREKETQRPQQFGSFPSRTDAQDFHFPAPSGRAQASPAARPNLEGERSAA
jgi:hypothetical protein